jgi:hypothetical protein
MLALLMLLTPASARADWLLVPFAGTGFGADTSFLTLEASRAHTVLGVSGVWLTDGVFGLEGDVLYGPGFFENGDILAIGSSVATLSAGVLATLPLSVTRESLRPYLSGGLGFAHAGIDYTIDILEVNRTLATMHVGGGAIGFVSTRTGFRFDLRHVRSLTREDERLTGARRTQLSFWRLTVGVVIRIG